MCVAGAVVLVAPAFLLFYLCFRLSFLFFLFADLLSDLEYLCLIVGLFLHYMEVDLQLWKHFQHLGKYYLYSLPGANEVTEEYGS